MASKKQIQANRRNALKSTGPKTPEGKSLARLNATKHGLHSQEVLLPGEDEAALKELAERLRAELQPVGEIDSLLVELNRRRLEASAPQSGGSWHIHL